jgi:hypothetical protein
MTSTTDIYVSQDLRAFSSLGFCSGTIVVTFDSYTDARHLDRSGFAEHFLHSRQIDAIHIISRDNDWYQYPELPQAAKVVAEITSQYGRVVAYGSSMGGYAAIRFGAMVGATTAVALSPQYSIDPRSVPFETRWTADAARVKFIFERNPPCSFARTSVIFFDPYTPDKAHVELYEGQTEIIRVRTPNSGHPSTNFLSEIGLLQDAIIQIAHDEFRPADIRQQIARRRRDSAQLYFTLSRRARQTDRRLRFAKMALNLRPDAPEYLSHYGTALACTGRFPPGGRRGTPTSALACSQSPCPAPAPQRVLRAVWRIGTSLRRYVCLAPGPSNRTHLSSANRLSVGAASRVGSCSRRQSVALQRLHLGCPSEPRQVAARSPEVLGRREWPLILLLFFVTGGSKGVHLHAISLTQKLRDC